MWEGKGGNRGKGTRMADSNATTSTGADFQGRRESLRHRGPISQLWQSQAGGCLKDG